MKRQAFRAALAAALSLFLAPLPATAQADPRPFDASVIKEGDHVVRSFRFESGETLPELRMHYRTIGQPRRNAAGEIENAVMILHGTGGSGAQFLVPRFADHLYGPGQPLDASRYFIILPDNIGHGRSAKPSDGLKMRFPAYTYNDMVEAQRRLLVDGLKINRLRLIFGTSMGCMHIFLWGEQHPDFAQALMPMACQAVPIAGRNRMWRKLAMDAIRADPAWKNGNYETQPLMGLRAASSLSVVAGTPPWWAQVNYPTREAAEAYLAERFEADLASRDANDFLYQFDSSRFYDPSPDLEKIRAPMTWINSADDFINPPELGLAEAVLPRLPTTRYVLIPPSPETRGHSTHTYALFWKDELQALLDRSR
ncbi:putative hydrolase [Sphingobium sp. SYK-6]|uniref:alpha/beta fold hydrolase n=1 Tax=Sphingobium sp. (strain NBRC 103272 / SYK-6) TaxID=627192 RepID=UPI00022772BC|nr:alpha/beta fold hydrolase [Sphingobium sp. SYK-6]BAK66497.1 putative hydrolase [Sphingobium sp. SYK-6]